MNIAYIKVPADEADHWTVPVSTPPCWLIFAKKKKECFFPDPKFKQSKALIYSDYKVCNDPELFNACQWFSCKYCSKADRCYVLEV